MRQLGNSVYVDGVYTGASLPNHCINETAASSYVLYNKIIRAYLEACDKRSPVELATALRLKKSCLKSNWLAKDELQYQLEMKLDSLNAQQLMLVMEKVDNGDFVFLFEKYKHIKSSLNELI